MSRPKGIKSKTQHIWSEDEKAYLEDITPGKHRREIHKLMNDKFEYQFTFEQIVAAIKRYKLKTGFTGQYEKWNVPYNKGTKGICKSNKTSFKTGHIPKNKKPIGSERVNIYGYTEVKVREPSKWEYKHKVIWKEHNGKIPRGYVVIFSDGDRGNLNIDNLILVSKQELLTLNHYDLIKDDKQLTEVGLNIAKVIIKTQEVNK